MSDPISDPNICADRSPASRDGIGSARSAPAKAERERRVVEGLKGGVSMAEIARREGISERGLRKYVRNLFARRAPEATGEFIATQMNRLNEALTVSFGAMSAENLPAVDRVVRIVRELDRYQGVCGGARGPSARRKLLESLVSGAEKDSPVLDGSDSSDPLSDILPDPAALPADCLWQEPAPGRTQARPGWEEQGARGTGMRRNPLETPDSGAGTPLSREDWTGGATEDDSDLIADLTRFLARPARQRGRPGEGGTGARRNLLESLNSRAETAPAPSLRAI